MITVTFACGHRLSVADNTGWQPRCEICQDNRVSRVHARAPRFVGTVSGPYAESKGLAPGVVNVAPGGSLTLKPLLEK